jgi:hypothetical protein
MKARPCHHVGLGAEDVMDAFLHVHQVDETEARIVGIEEQIHVAISSGFLPGDRSEQVKTSDPEAVQLGFVGAERRYYLLSIQGTLLNSNPIIQRIRGKSYDATGR